MAIIKGEKIGFSQFNPSNKKSMRWTVPGVNFQIRGSTEPAELQLYANATGFGWDFSVVHEHVPGIAHKLSIGHVHVAGYFFEFINCISCARIVGL
jgi:hypothetical protein